MTKVESEIIEGMARALWVHAYMNWVEMPPNMSGTWDEITPPTPAAARTAARDLAQLIESGVNESGLALGVPPTASIVDLYRGGDRRDPRAWGALVVQACLRTASVGGIPWPHFECHIEEGELVWDGEATQDHPSAMEPGKRKRMEDAAWRAGDASDFLRNPAVPWPRARVQSLLFPTFKFTASQAKQWARAHGYRYGSVDTTGAYHRIRQFDPDGAECRTIPFGDSGVKAIVCAAARRNPGPPENVVLHLEDDLLIQRGMARLLRKIFPGAEVITVDNVADAKRALAEHPNLTAILSDVDVNGPESGIDFFEFVKANYPDLVDRYTFLTGGHPEAGEMHYRYVSKGYVDYPVLREAMTRPAP